jgi:hypothetical protein
VNVPGKNRGHGASGKPWPQCDDVEIWDMAP